MPPRRRAAAVDFAELEMEVDHNSGSEDEYIAPSSSEHDSAPEPNTEPDPEAVHTPNIEMETVPDFRNLDEDLEEQKPTVGPASRRRIKRENADTEVTMRGGGRARPSDTLRDRMQLFYGTDDLELVNGAIARMKWGGIEFIPDPAELTDISWPSPLHSSSAGPFPENDNHEEQKIQGSTVDVDGVTLKPGQTREASGVFLFNAGAAVTKVEWAPGHLDKDKPQYLAVAVLDDTQNSPINASAARPMLAVSSAATVPTSWLYLYALQFESNSSPNAERFRRCNAIRLDKGPVRDIAWRPVLNSCEVALIYESGEAAILTLPLEHGPSGVPNVDILKLDRTASCVAWRGSENVLVGLADGGVAEFGRDGTPNFLVPVHYSVVTSIASAWPEHPDYFASSSVDGFTKVTDTRDVRRRQTPATRMSHKLSTLTWCGLVQSFVCQEDHVSSRLVPLRKPDYTTIMHQVTRHKGAIASVATSPLHPLILTGGEDGTLHVGNAVRRLVTRRPKTVFRDCALWVLECAERTSQFRFVDLLEANEISKPIGKRAAPVFPKASTITSVSWNPTAQWGTWYAAGTASGLVRVETVV